MARGHRAGPAPVSARAPSATDLLRLGLWLGLVVGLVEGVEWLALGLIPGALSWRTGNSSYAIWMAPLVMGTLGLALGAMAALAAAPARQPRRWDLGLVGLVTFLGAYLVATLQGQVFSEVAALLLAAGVTTVVLRWYGARRDRLLPFCARTALPLTAVVAVLALATIGGRRLGERRALAGLPSGPGGRPNVLLLLLDTQRADHLSLYGYGRPTSPALTAFAAEAVRYANASAPSSWTLPSHAGMFTGQPLHQHRAGILRRPYLDGRFPTVAEALRDAGYGTGGFVANTFWVGRQTGLARGFTHFEDFYGTVGDALARTTLGRRLAYEVLPRFGWTAMPGRKWAPRLNRDLLAWLDGLGDRPFFAFVNYFDVHAPLAPPPPYAGRFGGDTTAGTAREIDIGAIGATMQLPPPERLEALRNAYDESILSLDAALGELFAALRARGLLENTLVIITSDHGESWGEHGMIYHGHSLYQEQTSVPLVVRWPGGRHGGRVITTPVGVTQVPATVLDALGLGHAAFPGDPLPLVERPGTVVQTELARRSSVPSNWPASRGSVAALVTDSLHYIEEEDGRAELYHLGRDPRELTDLAAEPARAPLLADFSTRLASTLAGHGLSWRSPAPRTTP